MPRIAGAYMYGCMNEIHGHEVLQMMMTSGKSYTREALLADIAEAFGPGARFYTCSAEGLSAGQLIDFLQGKGKFVPVNGGFSASPDLMCGH